MLGSETMKKTNHILIMCSVFCITAMMLLSGCGNKSGGTYDEPEITSSYLTGEYSEQLLTDGAKTITGSVVLSKDGDSYTASVEQKKIVANSDYDEGYYVADTNLNTKLPFDEDVRLVVSDNGELKVSNPEEFIEKYNDLPDQLYTVYRMGDYLELIIPIDPADFI